MMPLGRMARLKMEKIGGHKVSLGGRLNDMGNEGNKEVQDGACFLS